MHLYQGGVSKKRTIVRSQVLALMHVAVRSFCCLKTSVPVLFFKQMLVSLSQIEKLVYFNCNLNDTVLSNVFLSNVRNHLNFDSLELEDELKYDRVRRLTNSDRVVSNPHFPSKWKIYWWNDFHWEEYSEVNVSSFF